LSRSVGLATAVMVGLPVGFFYTGRAVIHQGIFKGLVLWPIVFLAWILLLEA
jgi:hypothetical protein